MAFLCRKVNLLCKHSIKTSKVIPLTIKLLESSKAQSHACAVFIISSNHQYSTLRSPKTSDATHLLNHRWLLSGLVSRYQLSTDSVTDKVENLKTQTESTSSLGAAEASSSSVTNAVPDTPVAEHVSSAAGVTTSDPLATDLSIGNLSEDLSQTLTDTLSAVGNVEQSLSELGLARWTPVGLIQRFIEVLHVNLDLPWWSAIIVATFIARLFLLPVFIKAQQNAATFSNHMPEFQALQTKFNKARCSGNAIETARYGLELQEFMRKYNINPIKNALIPMIQAPVFISFFIGLRAMANLPVESLKTGGISWIMDLTVPDPYYITPLVTCSTLYIIIKIGAESGMKLENMKLARYIFTALPIIIFPFTIKFPAAVLCYWCATNLFTLGAVAIVKVDKVREACKIPKRNPVDPKFVPEKKGFVQGIKEAYEDQKMMQSVAERARMDEIRFRKSGTGPVPRTYAYDPTKPRPGAAAVARKAKEYEP